ncbi:MAG TPA: hypothetical protein P5081_01335 [Phycisphaerae bacterium]|nr:hypothetical protein [Phycisphaerae bacterium]HRW51497.1 hypothetical protein [Phycisphaerae bacterium]
MKTRSIIVVAIALPIMAVVAISARAAGLGWSDEPVIEGGYDAGWNDQPMQFEFQIWKDGSAEFKVTPVESLAEDLLPTTGLITVNTKTYKMAQRKDKDGKVCLFGSVPVDTFALNRTIEYSLKAYDANGRLLVNDEAEYYTQP